MATFLAAVHLKLFMSDIMTSYDDLTRHKLLCNYTLIILESYCVHKLLIQIYFTSLINSLCKLYLNNRPIVSKTRLTSVKYNVSVGIVF